MPEAFLIYCCPSYSTNLIIPATIAPYKIIQILESEKFLLVNPESWVWSPKFSIGESVRLTRNTESSTRNPESIWWNPDSKTIFNYLIGRLLAVDYVHTYSGWFGVLKMGIGVLKACIKTDPLAMTMGLNFDHKQSASFFKTTRLKALSLHCKLSSLNLF